MIGGMKTPHNHNRKTRESATVSISLAEDVKTVDDLEADPRSLMQQTRTTGRPIVIVETGKPAVVLMTGERYDWLVHCRTLARLLQEGEESIRKEGTIPADEVFKDLMDKGRSRRKKPARRRRQA